jgi:2-polyprenyl-3-methyl-5-hydroxy-6-metoxy-1,4-benzoquinol methylase
MLHLADGATQDADGEILEGELISGQGDHVYPVRNGIPRFVPASNYADNFGMQWNRFARTQLDSHSGHPVSANRFWHATDWHPASLKGKWILDVGCGSGRFAEVALNAGANVVALDYSTAVDALRANLEGQPGLHIVQGDIYALPFEPGSFDFVYSLGVLQHTPDVARSFAALPPMVAPGGRLCVDYYENSWKSALLPKYWLRPFTKRVPNEKLFARLEKALPFLLAASNTVGAIPVVGRTLRRIIPVANFKGEFELTPEQHREWALLDTFDWLSPEYDNPQSKKSAREMIEKAGMKEIEVLQAGHLVARGVR